MYPTRRGLTPPTGERAGQGIPASSRRGLAASLVAIALVVQSAPWIEALRIGVHASAFGQESGFAVLRAVLPAVLLVLAIFASWSTQLWVQLLGRASLGVVALLALGTGLSNPLLTTQAWIVLGSTVAALTALGASGLEDSLGSRSQFRPLALRTTLLTGLAVALTGGGLFAWASLATPVYGLVACLFWIGAFGLYRLQLWGLLASMGAALLAVPAGVWAMFDGALVGGGLVLGLAVLQQVLLSRVLLAITGNAPASVPVPSTRDLGPS